LTKIELPRNISEIMGKVHSRDTEPEMLFRRALWGRGVRYRTCPQDITGKPDIVVRAKKLAIFIDGDFWHGGQWSRRKLSSLESQFTRSKSRDYWLTKIRKNMERDCRSTAALISEGWTVLRFWESDIKKNLDKCITLTIDVAYNGPKQTPFSFAPHKTFAEFFAGIGLVRMALERHGWGVAYANDIDPNKHDMYSRHFQDTQELFDLSDIHKISADKIPNVTLATASFPCNDLSVAGSRNGLKGKQSCAFWGFIKLLEDMAYRRPPIVLIENVPGFLNSNKGQDFRDAMLALNRLGYSVDPFIVDAAWFVPQSRPRLFVVAQIEDTETCLKGKANIQPIEDRFRPKKLLDFIHDNDEIRWAVKNLPEIQTSHAELRDVLEDLPDDAPEWWSHDRTEYLLNQMNPRHRNLIEEMISRPDWSYGTVFRRMRNGKSMAEVRTDGIAGCLRTTRGGSARQILVKAGNGKFLVRLLTPLECARLMGAGDYNLSVNKSRALFGFGDAVCVPVIEWIAMQRLNPLVAELIRGRPL
jgi:DNA (cytosine-5)-methyltransferase 1